jgi:CDP-diacylglycerol--glycerol-3-phosphate 3-phosphatidyltransferase
MVSYSSIRPHIPNILTLLRVPALFLTVLFLYLSAPWSTAVAFGLYIVAAVSDWADGYIARRDKTTSVFGALFDALIDKVLNCGLFISFLSLPGYFPNNGYLFPVLLILTREFMVTGLRLVAAVNNLVLAAERSGKWKTAVQMISINILLANRAIRDLDTENKLPQRPLDILYQTGLVCFYASAILTFTSMVFYFRKHMGLIMESAGGKKE